MQGIESLGYEVVELSPVEALMSEGGIARHQQAAEMLADFGRNGDTYLVHAAEGETVLPLEVLESNPRLKNMIYTQMEEMGLEPERYVVGNELNSLNPETGQPEFFFKKLKKLVKKVVKKVKKVVKKVAPVVLAIAAPVLLPTMPIALAAGLGSTAGNLIAGKGLKDSLKSGIMTGLTAGAGNMIAGGSFLGSTVDPGNIAGLQKLGTMFTPDNPFTAAISSKITGVGAQVAQAGGKVGSGIFKQDFGGQEILPSPAGEIPETKLVGSTRGSGGQSVDFKDGLSKAFKPGDDYGFDDFFKEYLSPGRENISAAAQEGYKKDLAAFAKKFPDASATDYTNFVSKLDTKYAPGVLTKYGPAVGTVLAGGLASDTLLGTNIITPPEEEKVDLEALQNKGADLLASDPGTYGISDSYLGGNPFYDQVTNLPSDDLVYTKPGGPGSIMDYAPVFPGSRPTTGTGLPAAVINNPNAANPYEGMFGGDYFAQTPYSGLNYFNPNPLPPVGINPPPPPFMPRISAASGGEIVGPGTPTSDSVPAMLSDGEFVMNARAVRGAGGGDRQQGAKRMYEMMRSFERTA
tara:strand:- start:3202 stop:4929 length:1728 start_codon:yes stop_codon:yes gene_type:complete